MRCPIFRTCYSIVDSLTGGPRVPLVARFVSLMVLTSISLASSPGSASSFAYTAEELENASAEIQAGHARVAGEMLASSRNANGIIQIDDMLFLEDEVRQRSGFTGNMWPTGEVFYEFDANVTALNQTRWLAAAADWAAVANLTFTARTTEPNYIHVQSGSGNNSFVGMIGGSQTMNIFNWTFEFIIAHEIGHALGLLHEQSRSDRDTYVSILFANITAGKEGNFNIAGTTNFFAYDFDSALHYGRTAFSSNGLNTIEPKAPYTAWLSLIGQRSHLSVLDGDGMAQRYGSPNNRSTFLSIPLDSDPGWTTEGDWAFGTPTGGGSNGGDPTSGNTGSNVYGYNLNGDYPNDLPEMNLTTTAMNFTGYTNVELRFWRWLGVENSSFDHARIDVSSDGVSWSTVWNHTGSNISTGVWSLQSVDISALDNQPVAYVRWVMGETDLSITYPGWNIDDLEFRGSLGVGPTDVVYVDFAYSGGENGDTSTPWNTLAEALAVVDASGVIRINGNSSVVASGETFTGGSAINQGVTIEANPSGASGITIGAPPARNADDGSRSGFVTRERKTGE